MGLVPRPTLRLLPSINPFRVISPSLPTLNTFLHRHPWLSTFSLAYLMAALVGLAISRNLEFAFYFLSLLVIIAVVLALHAKVRFSDGVLWALSIWGAAHLAGGLVPLPTGWQYDGDQAVLYSWWLIPGMLKYDHVVHAFGFGTTAVAAVQALRGAGRSGRAAGRSIGGPGRSIGGPGRSIGEPGGRIKPTSGEMAAAILIGCGLGSVNEVLEFVATRISPETNVGGYVNTALDLVANLAGTVLAMGLSRVRGIR